MTKPRTPQIWHDGNLTYIRLTVRPNASKKSVLINKKGSLEISLTAKAESGKANGQLLEFLSKTLHLPEETIRIQHGSASRKKVIVINGTNINFVSQAFGLPQTEFLD